MIEPNIAIGGSAVAAYLAKDTLDKLLGPAAEYFGGEARSLVEKCNINLSDIFLRAIKKSGKDIDSPGGVSPRVVKKVIEQGAFCEDEVAKEYIAGILASSRTENIEDDRGMTLLALIDRISTYQIRAHYVIYSILINLYSDSGMRVTSGKQRTKMKAFIPTETFNKPMAINSEQTVMMWQHILFGLKRENLVHKFRFNSGEYTKSELDPGIVISPSPVGVELFLWINGWRSVSINDAFNSRLKFDSKKLIEIDTNYSKYES